MCRGRVFLTRPKHVLGHISGTNKATDLIFFLDSSIFYALQKSQWTLLSKIDRFQDILQKLIFVQKLAAILVLGGANPYVGPKTQIIVISSTDIIFDTRKNCYIMTFLKKVILTPV